MKPPTGELCLDGTISALAHMRGLKKTKQKGKGENKNVAVHIDVVAELFFFFFAHEAARAAGERDDISCQLDDLLMRRLPPDFICRGRP